MSHPRKSRSGLWVVLAILCLGLLFMAGLFWTAHRAISPIYRNAMPGMPAQLRIATWNVNDRSDVSTHMVPALRVVDADIILLQRIGRREAQALAHELNMTAAGKLQMSYSQSEEGENAIIARIPLFQGREMSRPNALGYGIFVEPVVAGKKFLVGCADFSADPGRSTSDADALLREWQKGGAAPLIVGGHFPDFLQARLGLSAVATAADERILASPGWTIADPRSQAVEGFSHPIVSATLRAAPAASSRP